jgi:hypothetical protein
VTTVEIKAETLDNLLRRDYLEDARWVITEACTLRGHPAKIDKPFEMKSEWQRGCVCGRNPYA